MTFYFISVSELRGSLFPQSTDTAGKLQPSASLMSRFHLEPDTPFSSHGSCSLVPRIRASLWVKLLLEPNDGGKILLHIN